MTEFVEEKAYAKLNISLDVTGKRPDGYHDMSMVMQTVSLSDTVKIMPGRGEGISAACNVPFIPSDDRNLAVKAAKLFCAAAGILSPSIHIRIDKIIPVGAGLAGGSADAAAVLRGMNRRYDYPLSETELMNIAGDTGSDVAFCLKGGTMLATGRGEVLKTLPDMPDCFYVICKPSFSVSTPELFKKLDEIRLRHHPDTAGIEKALQDRNLKEICRRMYNVFEDTGDRRLQTIADIKGSLLDFSALGSVMTGTGSAVFGVFDSTYPARKAAEELKRKYGFAVVAENIKELI